MFMDYILSMMDHKVSQCCRIYQLEDIRIQAGESPDELMECLHALAATSQPMIKRNVMCSIALFTPLVTSLL